jgi:hypothetical protein
MQIHLDNFFEQSVRLLDSVYIIVPSTSHYPIRKVVWLLSSITQCSGALLEKPPVAQLFNNVPTFYRLRRFITVLTRALQWFLSWARSIRSIPRHYISLRFILILSTRLHLGLPSGLLPSGFPTNILYVCFFFPCALHTCPSQPKLDNFKYIWRRAKFIKLHIMQLSPTSYNFIPLRSKHSPQHTISK